jgi:CheY-like chemotaxis protein
VQVAHNGRKALDMIATCAFDLVLLDIAMPGLNGYQVLQHLKHSETFRDLPVIMISGLHEMDSVVRCIELRKTIYPSLSTRCCSEIEWVTFWKKSGCEI